MTEYLCLTVLANAGESQAAFKGRLAAFWTHLLRNAPADYARVYSEEKAFESEKGRLCRRYMIEPDVAAALSAAVTANGLGFAPIDKADLYSKAEASSPEWFQLEH